MSDNFFDLLAFLLDAPLFWISLLVIVVSATILIGSLWPDASDEKLTKMEEERTKRLRERMGDEEHQLTQFYNTYQTPQERMENLERGTEKPKRKAGRPRKGGDIHD